MEGQSKGEDGLTDGGYPGVGVSYVGEGGVVNAGVVAEACGHALDGKGELVGEGVGGGGASYVPSDVATHEATSEGKAEELLRVREPVNKGGAEFCGLFRS